MSTLLCRLILKIFWFAVNCKVPKFLDARKLCCNLTKIQEKRPNLRVFHQKYADVIAKSEDPDQTTPRSEDPDQTAPLGAV